MRLQNPYYTISASVEAMPPLSQFDIVFNLNRMDTDGFYMARVFNIRYPDGTLKSIALVDHLCAEREPYAILENHHMTLLLFDSIVRIDLSTGLIEQCRDCENWGGLHEIHALKDGYIICGECDIFRYDLALNRIWHFMGRDMLVSAETDKHFWIEDDRIHCRDLSGWHYVLDLDGNLICDFLERNDAESR